MPDHESEPARKLALRGALRTALIFLPFLFAGRLDWRRGWIFIGLMLFTIAVNLTVIRWKNPGLLRVRLGKSQPAKRFDKVFAAVSLLASLALLAVAGLDARFLWSSLTFHWVYVGVALHALGMIPVTAAMAVNPYLERTVRIQDDRGHIVITSGPYRLVRHPMYAGFLLAISGWPLVLGSAWAFLPAGALAAAILARTVFEDRMLRNELPGYAEYCRRTRRLLPGIW